VAVKDFRKLQVWQKAHLLTLAVYKATADFPTEERYGLTSQLRRSAASIPANIAEGCGRTGPADFRRFLDVAMGSACELEYHWFLAHELGLLKAKEYESLADKTVAVKRMLAALIRALRADR
jgi:four helix bundle protein